MDLKGDPTKSLYLIFDPDGFTIINWSTLYQDS